MKTKLPRRHARILAVVPMRTVVRQIWNRSPIAKDPGRTGAVAGKAIERMQRDKARIAELEDKLRWRDCKTEPPTDTTFSLFRSAFIEENQMCFVWVDSIYLGNPSHPKYGYPAIEWRPIK